MQEGFGELVGSRLSYNINSTSYTASLQLVQSGIVGLGGNVCPADTDRTKGMPGRLDEDIQPVCNTANDGTASEEIAEDRSAEIIGAVPVEFAPSALILVVACRPADPKPQEWLDVRRLFRSCP